MSKWDARFIALASLVASWSKDPSTQVGAVIVDQDKRIVSTGFNGFPQGVNDAPVDREIKLLRTIHAEENALLFARRNVTGMTIYVTRPPVDFIERWALEMREAQAMFADVGVAVTVLGEAC